MKCYMTCGVGSVSRVCRDKMTQICKYNTRTMILKYYIIKIGTKTIQT